jgi:hypothetical protein
MTDAALTLAVSQIGPLLPRRLRGRQSASAEVAYQQQRAAFCQLILQIRSRLDFAIGSRGWCYILEQHGLGKGDFDAAQRLINDCRKTGDLPLDICSEDDSRETVGLQGEPDDPDIESEAESWVDYVREHAHKTYTPFSFWDDQEFYVEIAVEKLDLRNLFEPVCAGFFVPITNFKGWSDLNSRAHMMERFAEHEIEGRKCVLLLCGDHDPGGLAITASMRKTMQDLADAVGWSPDNLIITRFGLNADFINRHGLTWIDNLETSSGQRLDDRRHPDHNKPYVQDYLGRFGARKVEANALVVAPQVGRDLCRRAILQHLPADAPRRYRERLAVERARLMQAISELMRTAP